MLQNGLHGLDGLGLGYLLLQHHRLKLPDDLAVLDQLLHKTRLHHLTVVGDGIVEGDGIDGGYLCLVAYRHPGQRGLAPILRAVRGLRVRHADVGRMIAYQRQLQVFVDAHTVEPFHVAGGVAAVELVYDVADANVRADLQGACHIDVAIAAAAPVMVFHRATVHLHDTAARMDDEAGVVGDDLVVQGYQERRYLEHGTGLAAIADSRVDGFDIVAVLVLHHVDNGLHVACLHLHQDGYAHLAVH